MTERGKCGDLNYRYCHMLCLNAPGNYCSSPCPDGYEYSSTEDGCYPIYVPDVSPELPTKLRNLPIIIGPR